MKTKTLNLDFAISLLEQLLRLPPGDRVQKVQDFQRLVWHADEPVGPQEVEEVLRDLAFDLDFYEPDPAVRNEDPSYFGNDRLVEEIRAALRRLNVNEVPPS